MHRTVSAFIVLVFLAIGLAFPASSTEAGWALLRQGGQVVLIQHAIAPGSGDPANFDLERCGTQRNLSERGRLQARSMGALIDARAAPVEQVLTSRYCRARDTATQAFGAQNVETFAALDLLSQDSETAESQLDEIRARIAAYTGAGNLFMVTHEANIAALTGATTRDGEAVILARGGEKLGVAGRIRFN